MTKEQKHVLVEELADKFRAKPNFYIVDFGGFSVEKTNKLRRKCFESNIELRVVKNTLIKKALEKVEGDYSEIYKALKFESGVMFAEEDLKAPAKLIKSFREDGEKPALKAAFIQESIFIGDSSLEQLLVLKTKTEMIGEVVSILHGPIQNVLSGITGAGSKIAGLLKAIEEKKS